VAPKAPRKPFWWIGIAAVLAGLAIAADVGWFFYHSQQTGDSLLSAENAAIAAAGRISRFDPVVPTAVCPPFINGGSQAQGVISASEIGMAAPVLAGDGDSQINVAVGHADGSSWPGQPGTTLFAAHDVTYFSHINQLAVHSEIDFVTPCQTFTYQVTGHQVVQKGSPVYSPSTESLLVLETCYPTNALFLTDQRYLVTAQLVSVRLNDKALPAVASPPEPNLPIPAALSAEGLTLATNDLPLGTLSLAGTPSTSWEQTMAPYDSEGDVLSEYFGALRSAEQGQGAWWVAMSPTVPISATDPLRGATITEYTARVNPSLSVAGNVLTGAELDSVVRVSGGTAPGLYNLQVSFNVAFGQLFVSQWTMTHQ